MPGCLLVYHAQQAEHDKAAGGRGLSAGCKQAPVWGEFSGEELPPGVAALRCSRGLKFARKCLWELPAPHR